MTYFANLLKNDAMSNDISWMIGGEEGERTNFLSWPISSEMIREFQTIYQIGRSCFDKSEVFQGFLRPKNPKFSLPNYPSTSRGWGWAL
ncbi:MAG: hypothetical protein XD72_1764 [Methanothrix harundinacea]|uniref:Uncharacterized protein n=1 Tax=Methanothrix harundinacea TaxID=301375 RepID=A0A117MC68_9EURY|nr:MAG: hypothetical protein XD72_1764 [Methanothrix harundinacea]KUK95992.1 MAG: hypothetical protein XE07_1428 [Methanothrix harundinacea]